MGGYFCVLLLLLEPTEKPLGEFVREIVGLDMNAAKEAFAEYLTSTDLNVWSGIRKVIDEINSNATA